MAVDEQSAGERREVIWFSRIAVLVQTGFLHLVILKAIVEF
jgi:hypothetical protein